MPRDPGFDDEQRRAFFSSFAHHVVLLECFVKFADAGIAITRAKRLGRSNDPSRAEALIDHLKGLLGFVDKRLCRGIQQPPSLSLCDHCAESEVGFDAATRIATNTERTVKRIQGFVTGFFPAQGIRKTPSSIGIPIVEHENQPQRSPTQSPQLSRARSDSNRLFMRAKVDFQLLDLRPGSTSISEPGQTNLDSRDARPRLGQSPHTLNFSEKPE